MLTVCSWRWIQPVDAHTMIRRGGRSVADESTAANLLHRYPESIDVGALEGWLDAPTRLAICLRASKACSDRKTLGFHTPAEMFSERIALTG